MFKSIYFTTVLVLMFFIMSGVGFAVTASNNWNSTDYYIGDWTEYYDDYYFRTSEVYFATGVTMDFPLEGGLVSGTMYYKFTAGDYGVVYVANGTFSGTFSGGDYGVFEGTSDLTVDYPGLDLNMEFPGTFSGYIVTPGQITLSFIDSYESGYTGGYGGFSYLDLYYDVESSDADVNVDADADVDADVDADANVDADVDVDADASNSDVDVSDTEPYYKSKDFFAEDYLLDFLEAKISDEGSLDVWMGEPGKRQLVKIEDINDLVISHVSDFDDNGVSDLLQVQWGFDLFDGEDVGKKLFAGLGPEDEFVFPVKPKVILGVNSDEYFYTISDKPMIRVFAGSQEDVSVYFNDDLIGGGITDDDGFLIVVPNKALSGGGEIYAKGEAGSGEEVYVEIESGVSLEPEAKIIKAPDFTFVGDPTGYMVANVLDIIKKSANKNDVLSGTVEPGTVVFVGWKSAIVTSVVLSDASSGRFKLEIPKKLKIGKHNLYVSAYNSKTGVVSKVVKLAFSK